MPSLASGVRAIGAEREPVAAGFDWMYALEFGLNPRPARPSRRKEIAGGADGPTHIDDLHREVRPIVRAETYRNSPTLTDLMIAQLLDELLGREMYATVASAWGERDRAKAVQFWHKLDGPSQRPIRASIASRC